jgi:hypothetical protein
MPPWDRPVSPDGHWEWDGVQWVPRTPVRTLEGAPGGTGGAPTSGGGGRQPVLIVAAVAVVGGLVAAALAVTHPWSSSKHQAASTTTVATPATTVTTTVPDGQFPVRYTDPQGKFTASYSGQPTPGNKTQSSPAGRIPYTYAEYIGFGVDQTAGYFTLPVGATYDLHNGLEGAAGGAGGTLLSETRGRFQGFPSDTGVISYSAGYLEVSVVKAGTTVYIFGVTGTDNPPNSFPAFEALITLTPTS